MFIAEQSLYAGRNRQMIRATSQVFAAAGAISARVSELFKEHSQQNIIVHTDQLFSRLMICQMVFCSRSCAMAFRLGHGGAWTGQIHPHVWLAIFLGG